MMLSSSPKTHTNFHSISRPFNSMRALSILIFNAMMTGCMNGLMTDSDDTASINRAVQIRHDPANGSVFYQGPTMTHNAVRKDNPEVEDISLHAIKKPPDSIRYFITVNDRYRGHWRGAIQAADTEGKVFPAAFLQQSVNCEFHCEFDDTIEIELTEEYLVGHINSGIIMHLYGPGGSASAPFTVTPAYIKGFLSTIDKPFQSSNIGVHAGPIRKQ